MFACEWLKWWLNSDIGCISVRNPAMMSLSSMWQIKGNPPYCHMGIHLTYKLPTTNKRPRIPWRSVWCYSLGNFNKASEILYDVDWDTVTNESDIDLCWSNWQRTYLSIISQCVPQKLLPRKKHLPWISLPILKAIRKSNSLLNKYKCSGNQAILSLYKLTRN